MAYIKYTQGRAVLKIEWRVRGSKVYRTPPHKNACSKIDNCRCGPISDFCKLFIPSDVATMNLSKTCLNLSKADVRILLMILRIHDSTFNCTKVQEEDYSPQEWANMWTDL